MNFRKKLRIFLLLLLNLLENQTGVIIKHKQFQSKRDNVTFCLHIVVYFCKIVTLESLKAMHVLKLLYRLKYKFEFNCFSEETCLCK